MCKMRGMDATLDLKLGHSVQDALDDAVFETFDVAHKSCEERDEHLLELRAQNEGDSRTVGQGPWAGSCALEDPISREMHTTLLASLLQSVRYPYYIVEPVSSEDDVIASEIETWLNPKLRLDGWSDVLHDWAYTGLESRYAPLFVGWQQNIERSRERMIDTGDGMVPVFDEEAEGEDVIALRERVKSEGLLFRVPEPWDMYTYPAGAASYSPDVPGGADAVFERMWLTKQDLLRGIDELGYDADAVMQIINRPATGDPDSGRQQVQERVGVWTDADSGFYECFQMIGRAPILIDNDAKIITPRYILHEDICVLFCKDPRVVLKRTFSRFPMRPYVSWSAFPVPNSIMGHGIVSMLEAVQNEMTGTLRLAFDNMNLAASAPFVVPEHHVHRYGDVKFGPGRTIVAPANGLIEQLKVDSSAANLALQFQQYLYNRATQIAAAQGYNTMTGGPVRKATEVEFTANVVQTKFDLVVSNFGRGMVDAAQLILATLLQHIPDASPLATRSGDMEVLADEIVSRCRFVPQVSSDNVNAGLRLQKDLQMMSAVRQSPIYMMRVQSGDLSGEYALMRRFLHHMGETNPESIIGTEPPMGNAPVAAIQGMPQEQGGPVGQPEGA